MKHINVICRIALAAVVVISASLSTDLWGKDIVKDAASKKSVNRFLIRADGLACYFCAYGLERYFKKSGKIAAFDMNMEEGVVEATLLIGEPILSVETIESYIYDAGFTFRSIKAVLVGQVEERGGRIVFRISDTGDELTVRKNSALEKLLKDEDFLGQEVQIIAVAEKEEGAPMALVIEQWEPWVPTEG